MTPSQTHVSCRLTARLGARNELVHRRADAAANAADRALGSVWTDFLRLLKMRQSWADAQRAAWYIFATLYMRINDRLVPALFSSAGWSWRGTVKDIGAALPKKQLARAAGVAVVREDDSTSEPPLLALNDYLNILFSPPPAADVQRIIFGNQWQERLAACTRLADPQTLASIVANGVIQGKSNQDIAKAIRPAVNNVRSSARRIARTESVRVAGAMQMMAHEALGDLVIGFQLHSMHDHHTRPWHLARDGTIYYKNPAPGQKGLHQMPHPPDEPQDPAERPPGTPQTAWN